MVSEIDDNKGQMQHECTTGSSQGRAALPRQGLQALLLDGEHVALQFAGHVRQLPDECADQLAQVEWLQIQLLQNCRESVRHLPYSQRSHKPMPGQVSQLLSDM